VKGLRLTKLKQCKHSFNIEYIRGEKIRRDQDKSQGRRREKESGREMKRQADRQSGRKVDREREGGEEGGEEGEEEKRRPGGTKRATLKLI